LKKKLKKKEEERKRLDALHKAKMRELKKKLLDSMLEQDILNRKIGEQLEQTGKLQTDVFLTKNKINDINNKLDTEISDKEQIKQTKKKLAQELERAKVAKKKNQHTE